MYETIDEEAISPKEKFPITVDNVKDKYGIISYKTSKLERI